MKRLPIRVLGYNVLVVAGIVLLAIVLGVLNNRRVYPEQRVVIFGGPDYYADDAGALR